MEESKQNWAAAWHVPSKESVWSESSLSTEWVAKDPRFLYVGSRLIKLGRCPGWSESLLGAQVILLVMSCCGPNSQVDVYFVQFVSRFQMHQTHFAMADLVEECDQLTTGHKLSKGKSFLHTICHIFPKASFLNNQYLWFYTFFWPSWGLIILQLTLTVARYCLFLHTYLSLIFIVKIS